MNKLIPTFVILKLILFLLCQYSGSLQNVGLSLSHTHGRCKVMQPFLQFRHHKLKFNALSPPEAIHGEINLTFQFFQSLHPRLSS